MARDAAEILQRWRQRKLPEVPREEVLKVVEEYFPGEYTLKDRTSHFLEVESNALHLANLVGWTGRFLGGVLTIAHTGGKRVKRCYIDDLIEAIDIKQEIEGDYDVEAIRAMIEEARRTRRTR